MSVNEEVTGGGRKLQLSGWGLHVYDNYSSEQ